MSGTAAGPSPAFGFVEWFRPGEHRRAAAAIAGMAALGARHLRTHLSWADYHAPGGQEWFDWLIPTLGRQIDLLPCIHYTPPSLSRTGRASGPPRRLKDYADFVDHVLTRYGEHFRAVELWNEPNNLLDWDWRRDPDWQLFCEMVGGAAYWVEHRGWKAVLGGPSPFDPHWLDLLGQRGVLSVVSAVGFHGFPGTWDSEVDLWEGWDAHLAEMRTVLDRHAPGTEIWITEAGYATWRNDEAEQVERFRKALAAPADRLYWYGWQDIPRTVAVQEGLYFDPRHYHLGVHDAAGRPKLLARLLGKGGGTLPLAAPALGTRRTGQQPIVVTGGAGFIGSNLADALLADGEEVVVVDSLARPGVERNLDWLKARHGQALVPVLADVRDEHAVNEAVRGAKAVFHLAAQVAVTTSLDDPRDDFSVNAAGTLNVLEAVRRAGGDAPVIFASTNKVYGNLADVPLEERDGRHLPADAALRGAGIDETRPLSLCTPYGCSKGAADQYVLDYAHSYGLRTAVLRMSCVYGPRQFGTEDQGWVAHFMIRALAGEAVTIYGDGHQVRDVLHVADAVAAYRRLLAGIDAFSGRAFNLGGGPRNAVSLHDVLAEIEQLAGEPVARAYEPWRAGDQLYFTADTGLLRTTAGWRARVGWRDGLADLWDWLCAENGRPVAKRVRATA
jgi:CDP-paratose 2-epimerase